MSSLSVTNGDFVTGQVADVSDINQNFADIVDYMNANVVQIDGTVSFTNHFLLKAGTDPVSSQDAVRKFYADNWPPRNGLTAQKNPTVTQILGPTGVYTNWPTGGTGVLTFTFNKRYDQSSLIGYVTGSGLATVANTAVYSRLAFTKSATTVNANASVHYYNEANVHWNWFGATSMLSGMQAGAWTVNFQVGVLGAGSFACDANSIFSMEVKEVSPNV